MAIFSASGIWFPRLRGVWKGTQIEVGPLSCAAFALIFGFIGVALLVGEKLPEPQRIWLVLPVLIGFILVFIGQSRDARPNAQNPVIPFHLRSQRMRPSKRRNRIFIVLVLWMLGFLLYMRFR